MKVIKDSQFHVLHIDSNFYLDIDEVDPECVKQILEDHRNYPPQHRVGDPEGV